MPTSLAASEAAATCDVLLSGKEPHFLAGRSRASWRESTTVFGGERLLFRGEVPRFLEGTETQLNNMRPATSPCCVRFAITFVDRHRGFRPERGPLRIRFVE
eukprot:2917276-Pleurochrysis_carterae.AAC.1